MRHNVEPMQELKCARPTCIHWAADGCLVLRCQALWCCGQVGLSARCRLSYGRMGVRLLLLLLGGPCRR